MKKIKNNNLRFQIILSTIVIIFSSIIFLSLPVLFDYKSIKKSLEKQIFSEFKISVDIEAIHKPLVIEASTNAIVTSADDNGLFTISVIVPIILLIIRDELE